MQQGACMTKANRVSRTSQTGVWTVDATPALALLWETGFSYLSSWALASLTANPCRVPASPLIGVARSSHSSLWPTLYRCW